MLHTRRKVLKTGGGAGVLALLFAAGIVRPGEILAQSGFPAAFTMKTVPEAMRALGAQSPVVSSAILIKAPEIAENGAVVPIGIASAIPKTEAIAILVEKNPNMLVAVFELPAGTEPAISTRVKMGQSSNVYALVKADGKYYVASKEIKVTLGGCGG